MQDEKKKDEEIKKDENKEQTASQAAASAANIDAIISSPTENVRSRHTQQTWSNTGTNISYEGQTAPGGAGSVGTGQSSGQNAVESSIHTNDEYEQGRAEHPNKKDDGDSLAEPEEKNRDII